MLINHQMYDAVLLARCYTQKFNALFVIDSECNHIMHFIKIHFINYKGIDFIDLPSIFQNTSVTQSIPTYFPNSEPSTICYKPLSKTVFNFGILYWHVYFHDKIFLRGFEYHEEEI